MLPVPMKALPPRRILVILCLLAGVTFIAATTFFTGHATRALTYAQCQYGLGLSTPLVDLSGLNVAIVETETYHDEVEGAILYDLVNMGITPTVLRHRPYRYGFDNILRPFYAHEPVIAPLSEFASLVKNGSFDITIFVTCSGRFAEMVEVLAESGTWIVCVVHHANDQFKEAYNVLAKTGRFSLVTLSEHSAARQVELVEKWAEAHAPHWDAVDVHVAVPIFPAPGVPEISSSRTSVANRIVIQGSIDSSRRSYNKLFQDLVPLMREDLASWGYYQEGTNTSWLPLGDNLDSWTSSEPFSIHLLGSITKGHEPEVPVELENVVKYHGNIEYVEYYQLLASMDLLVPAFHHDGYFVNTASSSMPAALIGRVPVLASPRHTRSYGYLAPPAAIMRPPSMNDARAIQLLRQRQNPMPGYSFEDARPTFGEWDSYLRYILRRNKQTWYGILGKVMSQDLVLNLQCVD